MKKLAIIAASTLIAGLFLPFFITAATGAPSTADMPAWEQYEEYDETAALAPQDEPAAAETVRMLFTGEDAVREMALEEYVLGVLAAEMPASFEMEALKAQAVAVRTYTLYKKEREEETPGVIPEHKGAHVCDDYGHCRAYAQKDELTERWGADTDAYWEKLGRVVDDTRGLAVTVDGRPINAVFHAISSGRTESAAEVWGGDMDYLRSVESPGDLFAPAYLSGAEIATEEFWQRIESMAPGVDRGKRPAVDGITRTQGGGVDTVYIGGALLRGANIRAEFSLRSADFDIAYSDSVVVFTVRGYGHGVGMSQYGANELAKEGKTYEDILRWYYTGVDVIDTRF